MEQIIKTLAEIDQKSIKIMEAASNEKKELAQANQVRKEEYKKQAEEATLKKIDELRTQLTDKMNTELSLQSEQAQAELNTLDQEYENNHTKLAQQIFNELIK